MEGDRYARIVKQENRNAILFRYASVLDAYL